MNLREELLREHSKANTLAITAWIGGDKKRFAALVDLFLYDEYRVVQRAARVVSLVAEKQPQLLGPHLEAVVLHMQDAGIPVAVKRNVVRLLQHIDIPESLHGPVMNSCFDLLADPKETIAVRAFSMTVLARLAQQYPELGQELTVVIEDVLAHEPSAGLRSRGNKVLKAIRGNRKA